MQSSLRGTVVLPSLDRAHLVEEFFKAYLATESKVPGLLLVHDKDPMLEDYKALSLPEGWKLVLTKDAVTMGDKIRFVFKDIKDLDYVMILNDDHRPRTMHWDQAILSQINGHNIIGTNDGPTPDKPWNAPRRLSGAITFSGKILRALGWMFPEGLHHLYSDEIWGYLGSRAGCCQILMEVCVEHVHAYKDPSLKDNTFKIINGENGLDANGIGTGGLWDTDRIAFDKWFKEHAMEDAQKLIDLQPKQGVMLGFLSHDSNVSVDFAIGLMDTALFLAQNNIYFEVARIEGSSLISHARNSITDMFLKSKCQRLLCVDSDQGFNKNHVMALLQSNRPIIGGITPHKRFPLNINFEPLEEDKKYFKELTNKSREEFFNFAKEKANQKGEIEVNRIGTGFLMIDRSVFDHMKDHVNKYIPFDDKDNGLRHDEFFVMGSYKERYRGEDWRFCQLAKELKIPIYIHAGVRLVHQGTFKFSID